MTGILFFSSMSAYHAQIYLFLILPALIITAFKFKALSPLLLSRSFQLLLILFAFIILSFLWNNTEVSDLTKLKRLLLILTFIISLLYLNLNHKKRIIQVLLVASLFYAITGLYSIIDAYFINNTPITFRLIGVGNLSNPLLSSHIYGIFTVFIVAYYNTMPKTTFKSLLLAFLFLSMLSFIFFTYSRTALIGLTGAFAFLLWLQRSKKSLYIGVIIMIFIIIFTVMNFENISNRGLSYRPELWTIALEKIALRPVLGYGIGTELLIYIEELNKNFTEPHNIHLGLTYFLGGLGLLIWFLLLSSLFIFVIKNKNIPLAKIGGLMLAYGVTAGLTEGSNIFTRPKEIWFLTWLPISLIIIAEFNSKSQKKQTDNEINHKTIQTT
ncbi:MAG: O-antigen ligase family protein [Gammaproteobacteria bacterium]|nr:O-antigen ligase family protein [Gammaproteobacteria bacterium]